MNRPLFLLTGLVLASGAWLHAGDLSKPHQGRIIVPARHNAKGAKTLSHVIYSDDNGETWHIGGSVPRPQTTESTVVELNNGECSMKGEIWLTHRGKLTATTRSDSPSSRTSQFARPCP